LYLAGLLCDTGILVNSLPDQEEFQRVLVQAEASEAPLCAGEQEVLGFMHCERGRILADIWKLPADTSETIEFHDRPTIFAHSGVIRNASGSRKCLTSLNMHALMGKCSPACLCVKRSLL
jgi:HD-like signal output (HDOD) protein